MTPPSSLSEWQFQKEWLVYKFKLPSLAVFSHKVLKMTMGTEKTPSVVFPMNSYIFNFNTPFFIATSLRVKIWEFSRQKLVLQQIIVPKQTNVHYLITFLFLHRYIHNHQVLRQYSIVYQAKLMENTECMFSPPQDWTSGICYCSQQKASHLQVRVPKSSIALERKENSLGVAFVTTKNHDELVRILLSM